MRTNSRFLPLLFLLTICTATLQAQREETVLGTRGWGLTGIWGGYGHQYARFQDDYFYNRNGFFTFEFGKALTIGWSHNRLDDGLRFDQKPNSPFTMRWSAFKAGYAFAGYKAVHPTLGIEIGNSRLQLDGVRDRALVLSPSAGVEVNVFRWFRVGLEGGYRMVNGVDLEGLEDADLSGVYGQVNLKFGFSWGRHHANKRKSEVSRQRSRE